MERALHDAGLNPFYEQRRLRKNRNTGDIFAADDLTATMSGLQGYLQPKEVFSDFVADTLFDEDMTRQVNQGEPLDASATINFGTHDPFKFRLPHLNRRPPCKTDIATKKPDPSNTPTVEDDIHLQVPQEAQDSTWTLVVNETECQSYGPSTFCENVTNYPTWVTINPSSTSWFRKARAQISSRR